MSDTDLGTRFDAQDQVLRALMLRCDELQTANQELDAKVTGLVGRLDQLIASHNQVGENVAWLTANTQGIFAMLNDPSFISSMMGGMLSGVGRPGNASQERPGS